MNNDETVKLVAETLKAGMQKFIGEKNTESTAQEMKSHMVQTLMTFMNLDGMKAPLPEVKVNIDGSQATFSFFDPKTREQIDLATWMSRAHEGFYE